MSFDLIIRLVAKTQLKLFAADAAPKLKCGKASFSRCFLPLVCVGHRQNPKSIKKWGNCSRRLVEIETVNVSIFIEEHRRFIRSLPRAKIAKKEENKTERHQKSQRKCAQAENLFLYRFFGGLTFIGER